MIKIFTGAGLISKGESIIITSIIINSDFAPTALNLFEADGTTLILRLSVNAPAPGQIFEMTTPFLAKKGAFSSGAGTIFYSQGGA